ncbi:SRPBCC family protein [Streptomyces sp. NPDC001393]
MEFTNEIKLTQPTDEVFATLTNVERVATCLPGARLEGRDGEAYRGAMRIKVGPIVANYRGSVTFDELDPSARRAVLLASGEETNGQGSAQARIIGSVVDEGDGSRLVVTTDLQVRGRVAQFGGGAMEKIAKRMFADFAKNLERLMAGEQQAPTETPAKSPGVASVSEPAVSSVQDSNDSLDLVALLGEPVIRSVRRVGAPVLVALVIGYLVGHRRASV